MKIKNKITKTYPYVFHANGNAHKEEWTIWKFLIDYVSTLKNGHIPLSDDLTIVALKGGRYVNVDTPLEKCCRQFGVDLLLLPWPKQRIPNFWAGSKAKQSEVVKAIENGTISTKYMLFLDCGDTLFLKHPNEILKDFLEQFPEKVSLWNGEKNDWPRFELPKYKHHPVLDEFLLKVSARDNEIKKNLGTPYAFLNSGAYIGFTSEILKFNKQGVDEFGKIHTNDQLNARIIQYQHPQHAIDIHCNIFQSLYHTNKDDFEVIDE